MNPIEPTRFALSSSQEYVKSLIEKAGRTVLARADQSPSSLLLGSLFIRAVLNLPYALDQFPIKLSWTTDYGDSWATRTITIGHESLSFDTTEAFKSDQGWDHESTIDWEVDERRQVGWDEWVLEDVLSSFARDVADIECAVEFSTDYEHPFDHIIADPEPAAWHMAFTNPES
jgi:hypothetical protein